MTKSQKIQHEVNSIVIEQRVVDGFINGTAMCAAYEKNVSDWLRTDDTWDLVVALAEDLGIEPNSAKKPNSEKTRVSATYPGLVIVKRGSPENGGGTWLHPDLALQLAQWCSKPFAIQVSRWIREWMTIAINPIQLQADLERLAYRATLKDESRLRATGQVKVYLTQIGHYDDGNKRSKFFVQFHDAINVCITGEPAWRMKQRLAKLLGRKISENELIRDYFPPKQLNRYISICDAVANLLRTGQCEHPMTAIDIASELVLPDGYVPTPINFEKESTKLLAQKVQSLLLSSANPLL